jgi:hypothetical protein
MLLGTSRQYRRGQTNPHDRKVKKTHLFALLLPELKPLLF